MKNLVILMLICFSSIIAIAQNSESKPFIRANAFQLSHGMEFQSYSNSQSFSDFKAFANAPSLFSNDLNGYEGNNYNTSYLTSNSEVMLGLQFRNKNQTYNPNRELQIGFGFGSYIGNSFSFHKENKTRIDTLVSTQTNETYFQDSITNMYQNYDHKAEMIYLNLKYVFKTDVKKRFYGYAGIGMKLGFSVNSSISSSYSESSKLTYDLDDYHDSYYVPFNGYKIEGQSTKGPSVFLTNMQIKYGVNFRVSNTHNFWNHWNVFLENGTGIDYLQTGSDSFINIGNNVQLGFRYCLHELG